MSDASCSFPSITQFQVSRASLLFQKKFADAVSSILNKLGEELYKHFLLSFQSFCLTICMSLYKSYGRKDPRAKRPTGETTHLIRANRPTPKTRAKRPRAKRPGETTHGRNDPDSFNKVVDNKINLIYITFYYLNTLLYVFYI